MANWLVIVSILVFDLIAFALAITAEQRRSTVLALPVSSTGSSLWPRF